MKSQYRVVVIGGGNMGAGVLYHLAKEGWTDCALIEKAELTSGATWHAAGLVSRMIGGYSLGSLHDYAVDLYKTIEQETEVSVSWHGCGSMRVATSADHLDWINHLRDAILARGQDAHIISPDQVAKLNPLYNIENTGVIAALYTPDDGHVDPSGSCQAMIKGARQLGADVIRHNRVTDVNQLPNGEWQVITEQGSIVCEHVINAGGYHAKQIGEFSGLNLPITTIQHHYLITDNVPEFENLEHEIPVSRDDYFYGYLRAEQKSALIGLYDTQDPQTIWLDGCPWESKNELFEPNLDNITPWLEKFFHRCPTLEHLGIKRIVNGGITYTPDGAMLLGPATELKNYWLACGATAGIAWGPGAGRTLAQWMVHGSAEISTRAFDPRRFGSWTDTKYAKARSIEDYAIRHTIPYPQHQREVMREIKTSGAYKQTKALGALFEEAGGWERPRVYAPEPFGWRRTSVHEQVAKECKSVRERVGLGDFSAFAKFEISGEQADAFLNRVCANQLPRKIGGICLTLLLNKKGTIEGEATIAKLNENRFYFVTGGPSERRMWDWLTLHQRGSEKVEIINRTDEIGILTLAGPQSRKVLCQLTDYDLTNKNFGWLQAHELQVAGIDLTALRLSFTGELAWELHAPNQQLGELWDALWAAGKAYDIGVFGSKSIDSLRMEKFYRGGHELTNDVSHKEVGLMHFANFDKNFIGKQALLDRKRSSQCVLLALENEPCECLIGEAVFADSELVGSITSAAYGFSVSKSLAIAFVNQDAIQKNSELSISLLGENVSAKILESAAYDQNNEKLKT